MAGHTDSANYTVSARAFHHVALRILHVSASAGVAAIPETGIEGGRAILQETGVLIGIVGDIGRDVFAARGAGRDGESGEDDQCCVLH